MSAAQALNALLPQTQCRRCGYPACADYAAAMACGEVGPDRCPPGGDAVAEKLSMRLKLERHTVDRSLGEVAAWRSAVIVESACIGCTRCIAACPVDAIIGGAKLMHAVIEAECTGCDLCLPACPVDCIEMRPNSAWTPLGSLETWFVEGAPLAKARFDARRARGDGEGIRRETRVGMSDADSCLDSAPPPSAPREQHAVFVAAALARARARRAAAEPEQ